MSFIHIIISKLKGLFSKSDIDKSFLVIFLSQLFIISVLSESEKLVISCIISTCVSLLHKLLIHSETSLAEFSCHSTSMIQFFATIGLLSFHFLIITHGV